MRAPATFLRLRFLGYSARFALSMSRTVDRWNAEEQAGRVRLRFEPEDLHLADAFDIDETTEQGRREMSRILRQAEREGWWYAIVEVRRTTADPWTVADSLGALLGWADPDNRFRDGEALPPECRADLFERALSMLAEQDTAAAELSAALSRIEREALAASPTDATREALARVRSALADSLPEDPDNPRADREPLRPFLAVVPR